MKINTKFFVPVIAVFLSAANPFAANATPRPERIFFCGTSDGEPATMVRIPEKNEETALIRWVRELNSSVGITRQERCEMVSARFQEFYNQGTLAYMRGGIMNRQKVVCVSETKPGPCVGLLWTLRNRDEPNEVIKQLGIVSAYKRAPLNQSDILYVDMNELLELPQE
ncbi:COP23 domain-containing protein [Nostoc sp. UHCC 0702]|nr:COP23 domain-containing protein [Nostoc sp. UHCC 0702]